MNDKWLWEQTRQGAMRVEVTTTCVPQTYKARADRHLRERATIRRQDLVGLADVQRQLSVGGPQAYTPGERAEVTVGGHGCGPMVAEGE